MCAHINMDIERCIYIFMCAHMYISSLLLYIPLYIHIYVHTHTTTMIKESKAINLRECNKRDWEKENEEGSDIIIL